MREYRADSRESSPPGFLDQDVAQVEGLAGLDGEVLAGLVALVLDVDGGPVADPVQGAGDQGVEGDAAVGVRSQAVRVVLAIDVGQEGPVGRDRLAPGDLAHGRPAGGHQDLEVDVNLLDNGGLAVRADE